VPLLVDVVVVITTLVKALFAITVLENLISVFSTRDAVLALAFLDGHVRLLS
jgi:hypothetical protein